MIFSWYWYSSYCFFFFNWLISRLSSIFLESSSFTILFTISSWKKFDDDFLDKAGGELYDEDGLSEE